MAVFKVNIFDFRIFADEYSIDCNATQAAIRAEYNEKTAYSQGQRMLKNVEVKTYIDEQMAAVYNDFIMPDWLLPISRYIT